MSRTSALASNRTATSAGSLPAGPELAVCLRIRDHPSHTPRAHEALQPTWERILMPADLDALAAALLEKETVDEPEIRQATGLSPTPRRENRRPLIAAVANNGESSPA